MSIAKDERAPKGDDQMTPVLDVERVEDNFFRGIATPSGHGRSFGGQVIGQALMAATRTVETDRPAHSLHAYFMRPGNAAEPVLYQIERDRDGGSFTTRRVVAIQHGRQILNLSASFHEEEDGWDYQHEMRDVPGPEGLTTRAELIEANKDKVPENRRADFSRPRPIELREVQPQNLFEPSVLPDKNDLWFRMEAARGQETRMQHCLLAYASDMNLLGSSLRPHGLSWFKGGVVTASLDHAMWFHAPIAFENWHLYSMDAPFSGKGRGFNRGSIYTQDGQLVASVAQEGLVRRFKPKPKA